MVHNPPPLIAEIDEFLGRHEMSAITFGRKALKDPHFVRDLRAGRDLKLSTVEKIRAFMAEYVPEQALSEAPVQAALYRPASAEQAA